MRILVVGGAGYIGSHMVYHLAKQGVDVITLDNLSTGHRDAVLAGEFIQGDCGDREILKHIFSKNTIDAVMHFASSIEVAESVKNPAKYYQNNLVNTLALLEEMRSASINKFIFSSTAAVYGEPEYIPIDEQHPTKPLNPYGSSKLMVENILSDYDKAYGLKYICFRYFNAAGAHPDGILGERHDPETHLIPLILDAVNNPSKKISIYGDDYDTPDGTCIRDYIHVQDLVEAHWLGVKKLLEQEISATYNLGNGSGYSVNEVIEVAQAVVKLPLAINKCTRRPGDPAKLVALSSRAKKDLKWIPQYMNLENIINHAWQWKISVLKKTISEVNL